MAASDADLARGLGAQARRALPLARTQSILPLGSRSRDCRSRRDPAESNRRGAARATCFCTARSIRAAATALLACAEGAHSRSEWSRLLLAFLSDTLARHPGVPRECRSAPDARARRASTGTPGALGSYEAVGTSANRAEENRQIRPALGQGTARLTESERLQRRPFAAWVSMTGRPCGLPCRQLSFRAPGGRGGQTVLRDPGNDYLALAKAAGAPATDGDRRRAREGGRRGARRVPVLAVDLPPCSVVSMGSPGPLIGSGGARGG